MDNIKRKVSQFLKTSGIFVKQDWLEQCVDFIAEELGSDFKNTSQDTLNKYVIEQFLSSDLGLIGSGYTKTIDTKMHGEIIRGPFVFQVNDFKDIGNPMNEQIESFEEEEERETIEQILPPAPKKQKLNTWNHTLKLTCTDGRNTFYAFEYKFIPKFKLEEMKAGMKIGVKNVMVRLGVLMLVPECVTILGGEVEELMQEQLQKKKELKAKYEGKESPPRKNSSKVQSNDILFDDDDEW